MLDPLGAPGIAGSVNLGEDGRTLTEQPLRQCKELKVHGLGYIGIMEKKMETIGIIGFYTDYRVYFGVV